MTDDIDINVLGSDTIWNLSSKYFRKNRKVYWGGDFIAKRTVSYAVSIANTEKTVLTESNIQEYVDHIDYLSVRDSYSKNVLSHFAEKEIEIVCDPTMLFDRHYYYNLFSSDKIKNTIVVYYFGKVPINLQNALYKYANENQKKIVVIGNGMKGDVELISFSPDQFMECFVNADYIVTNTFHGTIFSINLRKQAVFNSDRKKKVEDLLSRFELKDHDYAMHNDVNLFYNKIDYSAIDGFIEDFRNKSKSYIDKILKQ